MLHMLEYFIMLVSICYVIQTQSVLLVYTDMAHEISVNLGMFSKSPAKMSCCTPRIRLKQVYGLMASTI